MIWNFVMDSFLEIFHTHAAEAIAYADDGALVIIHEDTDTAQHLMQTALDKAQSWAETVGLEFPISKTKAMLFSHKKDPPSLSSALHMCDEHIEVVETFKYLGVALDSRLDWNPHVKPQGQNGQTVPHDDSPRNRHHLGVLPGNTDQ
jgi:hypothetical protein